MPDRDLIHGMLALQDSLARLEEEAARLQLEEGAYLIRLTKLSVQDAIETGWEGSNALVN